MGRAKRLDRQREREARASLPTVYSAPIRCVLQECEATTELGFLGGGPQPLGFFRKDGWVGIPDQEQGVVVFLCPECYDKEREKKVNVSAFVSEVSG